ncbi:MAG: hypothetical protein JKY54_11970 [Flavobacteriales bacterium]|nr:hypothetical protein [Flavobacteriales bacterium]
MLKSGTEEYSKKLFFSSKKDAYPVCSMDEDPTQIFERACENGNVLELNRLLEDKQLIDPEVLEVGAGVALRNDDVEVFSLIYNEFGTLDWRNKNKIEDALFAVEKNSKSCLNYLVDKQGVRPSDVKHLYIYDDFKKMTPPGVAGP